MRPLWPVSDRATLPTEGLRFTGRPSVGRFGGVRRPAPNRGIPKLGIPKELELCY